MAINMADLEVRLSGGAGNTDPDASLGGILSTERVLSQSTAAPTNVTGVVIDYAAGNATGNGTLAYTNTGTTLEWTPNGGSIGTAIDVSVDGKYVIADSTGDAQLHVTVTAASLPGSDQNDADITIANIANEVFDDIAKQDSLDGDTEHRCVYVKNTHGSDSMLNVTIWRESDASGADSLQIGADPAGVGNGSTTGVATTIGDEGTPPGGVSFSAPTTQGTGINLGTLAAGESAAFWIERTVPADTTTSTPIDLSEIGLSAYL